MNDDELVNEIRFKLGQIPQNEKIALVPKGERTASVLIPLACHHEEIIVLFTHRAQNLNSHSGQVSFPGGMQEDNDRNAAATALRETEEEIGIRADKIELLGQLRYLRSHTGLVIYPFVGYVRDLNGLRRNLEEVERIFCIPYAWLSSPQNLYQEDYQRPGEKPHKVWTFRDFEGEKIWGITAELSRQLVTL